MLADVGVVLAGELAVGLLDLVLRRAARARRGSRSSPCISSPRSTRVQCEWAASAAAGGGATTPSHGVISVSVVACRVTWPIAKRSLHARGRGRGRTRRRGGRRASPGARSARPRSCRWPRRAGRGRRRRRAAPRARRGRHRGRSSVGTPSNMRCRESRNKPQVPSRMTSAIARLADRVEPGPAEPERRARRRRRRRPRPPRRRPCAGRRRATFRSSWLPRRKSSAVRAVDDDADRGDDHHRVGRRSAPAPRSRPIAAQASEPIATSSSSELANAARIDARFQP